MKDSLKLTYIYHDCFLIETNKCNIVFDYWMDPVSSRSSHPLFLDRLDKDKPLYVIVSHFHKDHFNRTIFEWSTLFPKIQYIISKDTERSVKYIFKPESLYAGTKVSYDIVRVIKPGEIFEDNFLKVSAFGSTDIGCSYMVETAGRKIFHAGDLNAWIWKDESTEAEINEAIGNFERILDGIAEKTDSFDFAMFPVDSRIGTDYWEGAKIFTRRFFVKHFFPMHFELADNDEQHRKRVADAIDFKEYANPERGEYIALTAPYSVFLDNGI